MRGAGHTYRRFGTLSIVKPLVDVFINAFNRKVVAQDRRVVLSQGAKSSADSSNETLFKEDAAVRHYRTLMQDFVEPNLLPHEAPIRIVDRKSQTSIRNETN